MHPIRDGIDDQPDSPARCDRRLVRAIQEDTGTLPGYLIIDLALFIRHFHFHHDMPITDMPIPPMPPF